MLIRSIFAGKTALALKRSCNFSRAKIERINTVARHVLLQTSRAVWCGSTDVITYASLNLSLAAEVKCDRSNISIVLISACAKLGTVFTLSFSSSSTIEEIHADSADGVNFLQMRWRPTRQTNRIILKKIERFAFHAVVVSADSPGGLTCRWRDEHNIFDYALDNRWNSLSFLVMPWVHVGLVRQNTGEKYSQPCVGVATVCDQVYWCIEEHHMHLFYEYVSHEFTVWGSQAFIAMLNSELRDEYFQTRHWLVAQPPANQILVNLHLFYHGFT